MSNPWFQFKKFTIQQDQSAMKVTTDACLFGAWVASRLNDKKLTALDIGTGTGLLVLMCAQKMESFQLDAIEIDPESFQQAKENVHASPWADRIRIIQGDARNYHFDSTYDIIISNPPFFENQLLSDNVKRNRALHDKGLLLDELFLLIKKWLKPGGQFYLLLPYSRIEELKDLLSRNKLGITQLCAVRQSVNHSPFRIMIEGSDGINENHTTEEIIIMEKDQQYSARFLNLLKDYYLRV